MNISIPYDGALVDVTFPDGAVILEPHPPLISDDCSVRDKIILAFGEFRDRFSNKKVTIVVNDATRRLPTWKILEVLSQLVSPDKIEVLVATGAHRTPTDAELDVIFGSARRFFEGRIAIHDCRDENSLTHLGYTSRGTPVEVNKKLADAECLICINSVEPHFFAGYTGGRKSLIPGLAGFTTTVLNHSLAKHEESRSLNLETNPLHQDLMEAIGLLGSKSVLSIQLVTSRQGEIIDMFCGELDWTFRQAVACAKNIYTVTIENKYEIVFAVGEPPLDANLYQLQKAQEHGAEAVSDGGILVVVGACNQGTGSDYFIRLAEDYPEPESALSSKAVADNRFGIHKLVKTARRLRRFKIWYVAKLDDKILRKVYYEPKKSLQAALDDAMAIMGRNSRVDATRVAILKDACFIVPVLGSIKGE